MTIQRRTGVDAAPGYRNGHGRPRRLARMSGTVRRRRPRGDLCKTLA